MRVWRAGQVEAEDVSVVAVLARGLQILYRHVELV